MITMQKIRDYVEAFSAELSPIEMAERELLEAKRRLLETLSALDQATATVYYHRARIERLTAYLEVQKHLAESKQVDNEPKV